MKIRPVGAELSHADGRMDGQMDRQTDMMKPITAFRNFASVGEWATPRFRRLIAVEVLFQSQVGRYGLCRGPRNTGTGFSQSTSVFCRLSSHNVHIQSLTYCRGYMVAQG
jgi:hypothetical protein